LRRVICALVIQLAFLKQCAMCRVLKPMSEFPLRRSNSGSRNAYCFSCKLTYQRNYYKRDAHNQRRRVGKNSRRYRKHNRRQVLAYLLTHPCVDCGEIDPRVLDFDHVRPGKVAEVSRLATSALRWERVAREIEKCDVRCANCHRRKTARERNWFHDLGDED
jgi:hypothetical protein